MILTRKQLSILMLNVFDWECLQAFILLKDLSYTKYDSKKQFFREYFLSDKSFDNAKFVKRIHVNFLLNFFSSNLTAYEKINDKALFASKHVQAETSIYQIGKAFLFPDILGNISSCEFYINKIQFGRR